MKELLRASTTAGAQEALSKESNLRKFIRPLLHNPFDECYIFCHDRVVWSMARCVGSEMFSGDNLALIAIRQVTRPKYEHAFVSRNMIEIKACSHGRNSQVFPLYLNHDDSADGDLRKTFGPAD